MTESAPLLITGRTGTLGQAFDRICETRGLPRVVTRRSDMDIADSHSVQAALHDIRPWAVVNTAGYVRVDQAEQEPDACERENTVGAVNLAHACASLGIPYVTYSTDLVFDGAQRQPYVESSPVAPLNVYGRTKATAERLVLESWPGSLVIRTSAFFGPWDEYNFAHVVLAVIDRGEPFIAAEDVTVSPTYVPALVNATLDLLIDGETGIWHLANRCSVTWKEFAVQVAEAAGRDPAMVVGTPCSELGLAAPRPAYTVLGSERGDLMPDLETGIRAYLHERSVAPTR